MIVSSMVVLFGGSLIFSLALTPLVRNFAVQLGWLDQPDSKRKTHRVAVPRVGGVPILFACAAAFAVLPLAHIPGTPAIAKSLPILWDLMPASVLIFITGLSDDLIDLKPIEKLGGQLLAAGLACVGGGLHFHIFERFTGGPALDVALTLLWLVACANAFNLIDGIDGLAAGLGFIATVTMLVAALRLGEIGIALIAAPLAGALLGFLYFNFNPASIFLGDSGSLWVGFILGCFSVMLSQKSLTFSGMIAPAVALSIPLLDTTLSFARRFVAGRPIFVGDHSHVHHRLVDRGLTPRAVCLSLYGAGVVASGFSLLLSVSSNFMGGIAILVFCASCSTAVQFLNYQEFLVFATLLRKLPSSVQSQLLLHSYEKLFRAATCPEECWRVLRQAGREFGFTHVGLQLGGRYFEEQTIASPKGAWKLSLPLSESDFVTFTGQYRSLITPEAGAQLAAVLQRALSTKPGLFEAAPEQDQAEQTFVPGRPVLEPRKSAILRRG